MPNSVSRSLLLAKSGYPGLDISKTGSRLWRARVDLLSNDRKSLVSLAENC